MLVTSIVLAVCTAISTGIAIREALGKREASERADRAEARAEREQDLRSPASSTLWSLTLGALTSNEPAPHSTSRCGAWPFRTTRAWPCSSRYPLAASRYSATSTSRAWAIIFLAP